MTKPIEVARQEFIDGMINFINEASLPSFLIAEVLEKILPAVKANIDKEYDRARTEYIQLLEAERKKIEERKTLDAQKGGDPEKETAKDKEEKRRKEAV